MKKVCLILVSICCFMGCSTYTPRPVSPLVLRAEQISNSGTNYLYAQEPQKRVMADEGPYFKENLRVQQQAAFEHEQRLQSLNYRSKEIEVARNLGLAVSTNNSLAAVCVNQRPLAGVRGSRTRIVAGKFLGIIPFSFQYTYVPVADAPQTTYVYHSDTGPNTTYMPTTYTSTYYPAPGSIFGHPNTSY